MCFNKLSFHRSPPPTVHSYLSLMLCAGLRHYSFPLVSLYRSIFLTLTHTHHNKKWEIKLILVCVSECERVGAANVFVCES
jgi:hypothetical protein